MNPKQKFIELSTCRSGVMVNGGYNFNTHNYIKKRHLNKKDTIIRKVCLCLLNAPELI